MFKISLLLLSFIVYLTPSNAQPIKLTCSEREKRREDTADPILVKTCFLKNFKFISTSYPDYAGRYFSSENEVFIKQGNKYVKSKNSKVFNKKQTILLNLINDQIYKDFQAFKADTNTKDCLSDITSIPTYHMDDFKILFNSEEIWFEVNWGLPGVCRAVDGTIVTFKMAEIYQYLN
jgi:hypothetical protein